MRLCVFAAVRVAGAIFFFSLAFVFRLVTTRETFAMSLVAQNGSAGRIADHAFIRLELPAPTPLRGL